jgi:hypothetical protein
MVTVVLRASTPVFPSTTSVTEPFPLPDAPDAIETHPALLAAVQEQPLCAAMPTTCEPPEESNARSDRSSVNTHGAPACCTINA